MFFVSVLVLLLILGLLITIHELGHFLFAKFSGANVTEFSIGLGPILIRTHWMGTPLHLRLLPLGGYVSLVGEVEDEGPGSFIRLNVIKQMLVILGGVIFNILSAFILLGVYLLAINSKVYMPIPVKPKYAQVLTSNTFIVIDKLDTNSTFRKYRDLVRDFPILFKINGERISNFSQLKKILKGYQPGSQIRITLKSLESDNTTIISVQLRADRKLGILVSEQQDIYWSYRNYPLLFRPVAYSYDILYVSFQFLKGIFINAIKNHQTQALEYSVGGPLSILPILNNTLVSKRPLVQIIGLLGLLSLNLAIINILPFPGLDGWHLVLVFIRKLIPFRTVHIYLKYVTYAGLLILFLFAIIITAKDINLVWHIYGR